MSADRDSKIIGYFAMRSPQAVVCTGPACVIAGSENAMRGFLEELHPGNKAQHIIRKTRFSEIMAGMRLGAPYAFDEESFARFYPLALEVGLPVAKPDFAEALKRGNRFLTLEILRA